MYMSQDIFTQYKYVPGHIYAMSREMYSQYIFRDILTQGHPKVREVTHLLIHASTHGSSIGQHPPAEWENLPGYFALKNTPPP